LPGIYFKPSSRPIITAGERVFENRIRRPEITGKFMICPKITILQITPYYPPGFAFGGPTFAAGALASGLQRLGHQVITVTSDRNGDGFSEVPASLVEPAGNRTIYCHTLRGRFLYAPGLAAAIRAVIQQAEVVLVPCGSWNYFFFSTCRAAQRFRKPYVIYPRGNFDPWALALKKWRKRLWWTLFDRNNYQRARAAVALTREEASQIRRMGFAGRIEVIPNGVEVADYQAAMPRRDIEGQFPQLRNKRWLLFMARLHPKKGLDLLLPALAEVRRQVPDAHLIIAGPDEDAYGRVVRRLISDLNLEGAVSLTGMVTGGLKHGLLRHAELFLLPSYSEGFPMGVLEAMACGLPVIITRNCQFPEVTENNSGIIVENDIKSLTNGILALLHDEILRKQCGVNAKRLVQERYTWKQIAIDTSRLLLELIDKKS
jgi:glycosyltransferase involved in cell wall biosynthesis